jgi:transposase
MLAKESQVEISVLHRQGKGIREIARATGLSRNTVRAVLRGEHDDVYGPRAPRPTKLSAHEEYLRERLASAGNHGLVATALFREIQERGYTGGMTHLKLLLAKLRPPSKVEPIVRFETLPGDQLQIDFVVFRRGDRPLRAFTASLGFHVCHMSSSSITNVLKRGSAA